VEPCGSMAGPPRRRKVANYEGMPRVTSCVIFRIGNSQRCEAYTVSLTIYGKISIISMIPYRYWIRRPLLLLPADEVWNTSDNPCVIVNPLAKVALSCIANNGFG